MAILTIWAAGLMRSWICGFESSAALIVVVAAAMVWSGWGAGRKMLVREGGG